MVFFGGLAASFGLFYDFSCEKLAELNTIEDTYQLQKAIAASTVAQDLLRGFANRNPEIANQFPQVAQLRNQVSNIRAASAARIKQRANRQTQTPPKSSSQPPFQKPVASTPPSPPLKREPQPPPRSSYQPPPQRPVAPTPPSPLPKSEPQPAFKRATQRKITPEKYKRILNQSDYVYVKGHLRNGHWVNEHFRRKPTR